MGQSPGLAISRPDDALGALAARVRPVALARQQQLPVLPALAPLLTDGALRRGATVSVAASAGAPGVAEAAGGGATSLALALAAGPSQAGSWVAAVGLGSLGLVAAAGLGVALDRLVLVDEPERGQWAPVVAALVDGFDVVLVAAGPRVRRRPTDARRLAARVRERGAVLVAVGGDLPERSHVRLSVEAGAWEGLEPTGLGRLSARRAVVVAGGRGEASRPRRAHLWLPSAAGEVSSADPVALAVPLDRHRASARHRHADVGDGAAGEAGTGAGRAGGGAGEPGGEPGERGGGGGGGEGWGDLVGTAG